MTDDRDIVYDVDASGMIVFVSPEWDRFALANGGHLATSAHVLSRPLLDFVSGANLREIFRQLLRRTRAGIRMQLDFRCDSPERRRLLRMNLAPLDAGAVRFRTQSLELEDRRPLQLLDSRADRSDEFLRVCSWCNKIWAGESWVEAEIAVERARLLEQRQLPALTHGICEPCHDSLLATLEQGNG